MKTELVILNHHVELEQNFNYPKTSFTCVREIDKYSNVINFHHTVRYKEEKLYHCSATQVRELMS